MATTHADEFRARASQARRIADNMQSRQAQIELRQMADALDAEAVKLETHAARSQPPQPINDM